MDAGLERPETRMFSSNVIEVVRQRRGELVVAALTVLRAWHIAGERIGLSPFGSFEDGPIGSANRWSGSGRSIPARRCLTYARAIRGGMR